VRPVLDHQSAEARQVIISVDQFTLEWQATTLPRKPIPREIESAIAERQAKEDHVNLLVASS
jgi:hypothetical protein